MADISLKFRAEKLGKSLENLSQRIDDEIRQAVKNLADAAYAAISARIQAMSIQDGSRKDYLKALKFKTLSHGSYLIYLDGEWANKLEEGFGSYSMKKTLLDSQKMVKVGSRAGLPWVRKAQDGHRYASVPFSHHSSRNKGSGDLATDLKKLVAEDQAGNVQPLTRIFKDIDGNARSGKVATVKEAENPNFKGMVKYQKVNPSGSVSSIYMTYRTISEIGKDWIHPAKKGFHLFKEMEEYVEREMDNIINTLLK